MSIFEQGNIKRVVLDTNVIVSASLSRNSNPGKIYKMFLAGELGLVYSAEILSEYEDVLYRPYLQIPVDDSNTIMTAIRQHGKKVWANPSNIRLIDEDDRVFYDVAVSERAYLVTGNTKHYPNEPFILTPAAFLELRNEKLRKQKPY